MLDALKKWLRPGASPQAGGGAVAAWAEKRQYAFRHVRGVEGFVIDGRVGTVPWRLEWGASQRPYVKGFELRLRAELGLPAHLQVLVLNRELQDGMEREVFDQFVEDVQTRIDTTTPPEMRWLVMLPKVPGSQIKPIRERFSAVTSHIPWVTAWMSGPLAAALDAGPRPGGGPLLLMVARGRMTLRTGLAEADIPDLEAWVRLFECAIRESNRVSAELGDPEAPSTQPSLWASSTSAASRSGPATD